MALYKKCSKGLFAIHYEEQAKKFERGWAKRAVRLREQDQHDRMRKEAASKHRVEEPKRMKSFIQRVFRMRIVRYGLVGGVGIPVNDLALFCFMSLLTPLFPPKSAFLYAIASACAFEVSNIVNFTLNQFFTYREQVKDIHGWEWVRRAAKGQLTSLSAMLLSYGVGLLLFYVFHVNEYFANPAGIIVAFVYNFFVSRKLVFRPAAPPAQPVQEKEPASPSASSEENSQIEATPH